MSILTEKAPETVMVDGASFNVDSDFANILQMFEVLESTTLDEAESCTTALYLFYGETIPPNIESAYKAIVGFISKGKEKPKDNDEKPVIDFTQDADLIYSAFMATYGIDLTKTNMHWWHFLSLLEDISEDTLLSKVKKIRGIDLATIKDKKQKAEIIKAKKQVKISKKKIVNEQREQIFEALETR